MRAGDTHSNRAKVRSVAGGCSSVREAVVEALGPDTVLRPRARYAQIRRQLDVWH